MKSSINLHIHSSWSDGVKTVAQIVDGLHKAGVDVFSICDHNTVRGNCDAFDLAKERGMRFISGVELSCVFDGEAGLFSDYQPHVLGLGIDIRDMAECIGIQRQFGSFPAIKTAIQNIHKCGGVAVWAHPFNAVNRYRMVQLEKDKVGKIAGILKEYGLDGMEVYYQDFDVGQIKWLEEVAYKCGLLKSIGTDYHGHDGRLSNEFAFNKEGVVAKASILEKL